MSPILLRRLPVPSAVRFAVRSRQLSTSRVVFGLKESARVEVITDASRGSQDVENRHEEVEHHKQELLRKQKDGKGHWTEQLASDSESAVKADRGEAEAEKEIASLQKETEKLAKETENITEGKQEKF